MFNERGNKLKIGIITHHYVKNYGAFLQAYALQQTLISLYPNAQVEVINYINLKHYFASLRPLIITKPQSSDFINANKMFFDTKKQLIQFIKAKKNLNLSSWCRNVKDINKKNYDYIIIGSDEVWNINSVSFDQIKFGVDLICPNIISYAPSVGSFKHSQELPTSVLNGLRKFKNISVRDNQTLDMVERFYDGNIQMVLDPTFLYDFHSETRSVETQNYSPYILVYQCILDMEQILLLKKYADENGLIIIGAGCHQDWFDKSLLNISPFQWICLFNNAQYIITGTFHGTIFSIKAKKKFIVYPTLPNRIEKVQSLLNLFGLEIQLVPKENKNDLCNFLVNEIDYHNVYQRVNELKQRSITFLKESLVSIEGQ